MHNPRCPNQHSWLESNRENSSLFITNAINFIFRRQQPSRGVLKHFLTTLIGRKFLSFDNNPPPQPPPHSNLKLFS